MISRKHCNRYCIIVPETLSLKYEFHSVMVCLGACTRLKLYYTFKESEGVQRLQIFMFQLQYIHMLIRIRGICVIAVLVVPLFCFCECLYYF